MFVRRRLAVIGGALGVIAIVAALYLKPEGSDRTEPLITASFRPVAGYSVDYDFVNPTHGWALLYDDEAVNGDFLVFRTTDAAEHWQRQYSGYAKQGGPFLQFVDERNGFLFYGGDEYRTTDGGDNWQFTTLPGPGFLISFAGSDDGWAEIFEAGGAHMYRTVDGGTTWTRIRTDPPDSASVGPGDGGSSSFRASGEGWFGAEAEPKPVAFKTPDGGDTWQTISLAPRYPFALPGHLYSTTVELIDSKTVAVYVFDQFVRLLAVLLSADDGSTWQSVSFPIDPSVDMINFLDADHAWLFAAESVYITEDRGESWRQLQHSGIPVEWTPTRARAIDSRHAFWILQSAADSRRTALAMTSDAGLHWRLVNSPQP